MYINNIVMDIVKALLIVGRYCRFIFFCYFTLTPSPIASEVPVYRTSEV